MTVRAKFKVTAVTHTEHGGEITLTPVTGGSPENEQFFKWTPYGSIKIGVVSQAVAECFAPGKEFFVDFTEAV